MRSTYVAELYILLELFMTVRIEQVPDHEDEMSLRHRTTI